MTLQSTVSLSQGFGVVGEEFLAGPRRAYPATIYSDGVTNPNRVGRVFTLTLSQGDGQVSVGGVGPMPALLANPKVYPLQGTAAGGTLAPSLDLPQYAEAEFVYESTGTIVSLPAAANVGDDVLYDTTTGALQTQPGSAPATGAQRAAFASNVMTVTLVPAGFPPIGVGSKIVTADGQSTTVTSLGSGTGGNGTYNVGTVTDHAAQAFTLTNPAIPSGKARFPGWQVVRYSIDAGGIAVIGNYN